MFKKVMFTVFVALFSVASNAAVIPELPSADAVLYKIFAITANKVGKQGSGVAVSGNKILTNCHVVSDAVKVIAIDPDGKRFDVDGVSSDAFHDACTIRVVGSLATYATQARFTSNGDTVYAIGFPSGQFTWSKGAVTNAEGKMNGEDVIFSSTYCNSGISGGALLNSKGEFVGLLFAKKNDDNSCVAVPNYLLQRSLSGSMSSLSVGTPRSATGSAYHNSW